MNDFDQTYFEGLYGTCPGQTWADRSRDAGIAGLVHKYAPARTPGDAVLDIGCGYGFLLERFSGRYALFGIDISQHAVSVAAARLPSATLAVADVQAGLPFGGPFRAVLLVNVLEHLPNPSTAVRSVWTVLAPGGLCVVHLPTINNLCSRLYYNRSYAKDATHVYRPSGPEVTRLFQAVGFQPVVESYAPHVPGWLWRALKPFPPFQGAYRRP